MKNTTTLLSAVTAVLLSAAQAQAADAVKGAQALEKNQCASCHGTDYSKSIDNTIPKLAGQHRDYLVQALRQYKLGESKSMALARNNGTMTAQVKKLSNSDIENIAAYLSALKGDLSVSK